MASRDTLYTEIPKDVLQIRALGERHCVPQDCVSSVGVTEQDGEYVVKIGIKQDTREQLELPSNVTDSDVIIEEVGTFTTTQTVSDTSEKEQFAYTAKDGIYDRESKWRPVPLGVSAGHKDVTAGTAGWLVEDDQGTVYASSNNHVYGDENAGVEGDEILQPGPVDGGGIANDTSATFEGRVPFDSGDNLVDFAWGEQVATHVNEIAGLPAPIGSPQVPDIGDFVSLSGQTSGIQHDTVDSIDATITVKYDSGNLYDFVETILTENAISAGGDSGAPVLSTDDRPIGINFAGTSSTAAFNRATNIESESGLTIVTEPLPGTSDTASKFSVQFEQNVGEPSKVWFDLARQWNSPQKNRDIQVVGDEIELSTGEEFGFIVPTAQNWEGT